MGNFISSRFSEGPIANRNLHNGDMRMPVVLSSERNETSLQRTLIRFLDKIHYSYTSYPEFEDLELAAKNQILSFGLDLRPGWEKILHTSCTLVGMEYFKHPIEMQISITIITWFGLTMDDCASKGDPVALVTFQHHYLTRQPQVDPFFDHYTAQFTNLWKHYHPIGANVSVSALMDFASACYLEIMTEGMKINPAAAHYPDYVRLKSGVADFYAFGIWPAAQFPDITVYLQAVPAVARFANIVNDILSFYKEELAGETLNYVHLLRAVGRKESELEVLHDLIEEAAGLSEEIDALLVGDAKEMWECWKVGYITYHLCDSRYKLSELSLIKGEGDASKVE